MAKLAWNALISKHPNRYYLLLMFHDHLAAKKSAAKRKISIPPFPDGKILPTPNAIISALAKAKCKGDYSMQSEKSGCYVTLMMSDKADAETMSKSWGKGNGAPCTETAVKDMWAKERWSSPKSFDSSSVLELF